LAPASLCLSLTAVAKSLFKTILALGGDAQADFKVSLSKLF
jgi:hypothetical protein